MSSVKTPDLSVTGGPGRPQDSDDTSSTGGTGGMGYTGGSGASGFGGGLGKKVDSIMNIEEGVDTFARNVTGTGLYGATGGPGQHGPLDKVPMDNSSLAAMGKQFEDKINKMASIDDIVDDFHTCQTTLDLVLQKTNAVNALFAFMQGKRLLRIKALFIQGNNKDWQKWIPTKVPNLEKRTRQKYMNLASVPMVETHLEYGVERLAQFGSFYASKTKDEKTEMNPDPFRWYLEKFNVNMDTSYDERREYVDSVLEVGKLERMGLEFPLEVMTSFLRVQDPLTGDERKHLKKLGMEEAVKLLNRIIAKELKRKNLIAGTDSPPPSERNSKDASTDVGAPLPVTGPNIEKQVVTLCKSLESITSHGIKLDRTVDRDSLVKLKGYIEQLLELSPDATA